MEGSYACLCGGESERRFEKHGVWIRACTRCGHCFAEVQPSDEHVDTVYGDEYFSGGGAGYPDYLTEEKILRSRGRMYGQLLARYHAPGSVLDVGAAAGFVLKGLEDAGWRGTGLEPNAGMAAHGRSRLGVDLVVGSLERMVPARQFDAITMVQVVSHFNDLRRALSVASEATAPGGIWLIETWDRGSLTARLFGQNWHEYSPPSVLHWFTRPGLRDAVARFGFEQIATGRPSKWISGAHARALLAHTAPDTLVGRTFAAAASCIPGRLSLPYPAEDLFWAVFKKKR